MIKSQGNAEKSIFLIIYSWIRPYESLILAWILYFCAHMGVDMIFFEPIWVWIWSFLSPYEWGQRKVARKCRSGELHPDEKNTIIQKFLCSWIVLLPIEQPRIKCAFNYEVCIFCQKIWSPHKIIICIKMQLSLIESVSIFGPPHTRPPKECGYAEFGTRALHRRELRYVRARDTKYATFHRRNAGSRYRPSRK